MKKHHSCHSRRKEGENDAAALSKAHILTIQKKRRQTNKQKTKLTGMQNLKIQKIQKFKLYAHIHKLPVISGAAHRDQIFELIMCSNGFDFKNFEPWLARGKSEAPEKTAPKPTAPMRSMIDRYVQCIVLTN
jgi:hypothetical protein